MSLGSVRLCGRRGLVVFCPECREWRPYVDRHVIPGRFAEGPEGKYVTGGVGGFFAGRREFACAVCESVFPEIKPFNPPVRSSEDEAKLALMDPETREEFDLFSEPGEDVDLWLIRSRRCRLCTKSLPGCTPEGCRGLQSS